MKTINIMFVFMTLILIMMLVGSISALTGSIGDAKRILRAETGDVIEKTIRVQNVNDEDVDVELFASGDLVKYIEIHDAKFTLIPNETKKARFTLTVGKEGTTESKINVQFSPIDGGNGVGLTSTMIVIAEKGDNWFEGLFDDDDDEIVNVDSIGGITGSTIDESNNKRKPLMIAVSITTIFLLVFLVLLTIASGKTKDVKIKSKKRKRK